MGRKILFLSMVLASVFQQAAACDVCGCSVSGSNIGLMAAYRYNFVSMQWQHSGFQSTPGHGTGSKDAFHTLELMARYHLSDRFKVLVHQPFKMNFRTTGDEKSSLSGLSDTRVLANYTLIRNVRIGESAGLYWEIGAGLKLPTGKYNPDIHDRNLPENFNLGNGSWGYLFQSNLVLNHKKSGLILANSYQLNGKTPQGYAFGNQFTSQLLGFREFNVKDALKLTPNAGLYAERVFDDNYANNNTVTGTGGTGLFVSAGIQLKKENWLAGIAYAAPIVQHYSDKEVEASGRISCQITYVF